MIKRSISEGETQVKILESAALCRHVRADGHLLLTVKVNYPCLTSLIDGVTPRMILSAADEAAERFNGCYAQAAERYLAAGIEEMAERMITAYTALPLDQRYGFWRQELLCDMIAELFPTPLGGEMAMDPTEMQETWVRVMIQRSFGRARRQNRMTQSTEEHWWRFPMGIWEKSAPENSKKYKKTIEKTQ